MCSVYLQIVLMFD